jgi:hypothetical protein
MALDTRKTQEMTESKTRGFQPNQISVSSFLFLPLQEWEKLCIKTESERVENLILRTRHV